jgi:hypothetical protein
MSAKKWRQFNLILLTVGSFLLLLNWLRPYALQYVHECAKYNHPDMPAFIDAFIVIVMLANILYGGLFWCLSQFDGMKPYRHAVISWVLLLLVVWLLTNDFLVSELPALINNPEILCD